MSAIDCRNSCGAAIFALVQQGLCRIPGTVHLIRFFILDHIDKYTIPGIDQISSDNGE